LRVAGGLSGWALDGRFTLLLGDNSERTGKENFSGAVLMVFWGFLPNL
jgi:hypothetical protein